MDVRSSSSESVRNVSGIPLVKTPSTSKTTQTDGMSYVFCFDPEFSNKKIYFNDATDVWKSQLLPMCPTYNNPLVSQIALCHLSNYFSQSMCHFPLQWYPFHSFGTFLPFNMMPPFVQLPMVMAPSHHMPCSAALMNPNFQCIGKDLNYHLCVNDCRSNVSMKSIIGRNKKEIITTQNKNERPSKYYNLIGYNNSEISSKNKNVVKRLQQKYLKNNNRAENLQNTYTSDTSVYSNSLLTKGQIGPRNATTRSSVNCCGSLPSSRSDKGPNKKRLPYIHTDNNLSNHKNIIKTSSSTSNSLIRSESKNDTRLNSRNITKRYISKSLSLPISFNSNDVGEDENYDDEISQHNVESHSHVKKLANFLCDFENNLNYPNSDYYNSIIKKSIDVALDKTSLQEICSADNMQKCKKMKLSGNNSSNVVPVMDLSTGCFKSSENISIDQYSMEKKNSNSDCSCSSSKFNSSNSKKMSFIKTSDLVSSAYEERLKNKFLGSKEKSFINADKIMESVCQDRLKSKLSSSKDRLVVRNGASKEYINEEECKSKLTTSAEGLMIRDNNSIECVYENLSRSRLSVSSDKSNFRLDNLTECDYDSQSHHKLMINSEKAVTENDNKAEHQFDSKSRDKLSSTIKKAVKSDSLIEFNVDDNQNQHTSFNPNSSDSVVFPIVNTPLQFNNDNDQSTFQQQSYVSNTWHANNQEEHSTKNYANYAELSVYPNQNIFNYSYINSNAYRLPDTTLEASKSPPSCVNELVYKDTNLNNGYSKCEIKHSSFNDESSIMEIKNFNPEDNDGVEICDREFLESNKSELFSNKKETNKQIEIQQELLKINELFMKQTDKNVEDDKTNKKKFESITAHFILPTVYKNENNININDDVNNEPDKNFTKISFSVNYDPNNPEVVVVDCEQDGKNLSETTMNNSDNLCSMNYMTVDAPSITECMDDVNDLYCDRNQNSSINNNGKYWPMDDVPNSVTNEPCIAPKRRSRYSQYSMLNNIETLSIISEEDEDSYSKNGSTTTNTSNTGSMDTYVLNKNCVGDVQRSKNKTQITKYDKDHFN